MAQVLTDMNEAGGFLMAVITDRHGFPIAAATQSDQDPETPSAVVALVQKTAQQVEGQLGLAPTDEVSLSDAAGRRLLCRPIHIKEHQLILAVLIPTRQQAYRRLTNHAVSQIKRQWRL